jgi:hypothetical protein
LPWRSTVGAVPYGAQGYGEILTAAKSIKVLHQGAEDAVQQNFKTAQEWLRWADRIVVLGFGFHKDSVERLALGDILKDKEGTIATCMGLDATSRERVEFYWQKVVGRSRNIHFPAPDADCYKLLHDHVVLS